MNYSLVEVSSKEQGLPPEVILGDFGEYPVSNIATVHYAGILNGWFSGIPTS
ncbi:MAG: hypothetical protein NTX70_11125 [Verrucomicrobia bacterium]|jgi:hypothetical protein|nr:hypothetical protein [Verrucomicrobiota bacterium]